MLTECKCWLLMSSEPDPTDTCNNAINEYDKGVAYLDVNKLFRKPTDKEIAESHYVSTEQAIDRAATVCRTMCGLRVCYDNFPGSPEGHYGDRNGRKLKWVRRKDGKVPTCGNCIAAHNAAVFYMKDEREWAR